MFAREFGNFNRQANGKTKTEIHRSMTLAVPEGAEVSRARLISRRKMSLGSSPLMANGRRTQSSRRASIAGRFK
ncbi:unnamed protein product [Cylicocyclus nassatus]|uniref:Uncharacterized protein n=1 Tax=Cylicocyclus nassatus TaxID=53992 RepID=A0AA36MH38_CYLNA|nr:unnamed protein product [Cylicocyclus nassatus]